MHTRCLGIAAIVFVLAADRCWAQADDAEKEVTKQTTRQISSAIVGRVTATEGSAPGAVAVWSTTSYNWISIRNGSSSGFGVTPGAVAPPDFSVRLFQQIIGADTRVGPFVLGLSGAFSHTGGDQAGFATPPGFSTGSTDLTGHSFSVSPYAAFVLDQYFFFTGLVGYTRGTSSVTTGASMFSFPGLPPTTFPGSDIDSNADTFFTDVAGNVVYPIPDTPITLGGRAGYRYQYSWVHQDNAPSTGFGNNTYYAAVEGRYSIDAWVPYVRAQYEYYQPLSGPFGNPNAVFLLAGIDYHVTPTFTAGLHYMNQLGNPSIRNHQLALNMRLLF
jgi:hypothetical protein